MMFLAAIGLLAATMAPSPSASPSPAAAPVSIRLSASKVMYHAWEPVLLKVEVVNTSNAPVRVLGLTPWDATALAVTKGGADVAKASPAVPYEWRSPYESSIKPGGSMVLYWQQGTNPITFWGYAPLKEGDYVITAVPRRIEGETAAGAHFSLDQSARSNSVEITVIP